MKRRIVINYEWERLDKRPIKTEHAEKLEAYAEGKALEGISENVSGDSIAVSIGGIIYSGQWHAFKS